LTSIKCGIAVFTAVVPHDVSEKYVTLCIKTYVDMYDEIVMGIHRFCPCILYTALAVTR
jgi:hypothetical protein